MSSTAINVDNSSWMLIFCIKMYKFYFYKQQIKLVGYKSCREVNLMNFY